MSRSTKRIIAFLLLLTGCVHYRIVTPQTPPVDAFADPPYGLGQICLLRPHSLGALVTFVVHDNGMLVGATRGPGYFCYHVQPGLHQITSDSGNVAAVSLAVNAGGRYYLHQVVRIGPDELTAIDEQQAMQLLPRCEYQILVDPVL